MTVTMVPVALTAAAAAALLNLWLAVRVIRVRQSASILYGDGGNDRLAARMRAQLNFAEYTPIVLILIALIELMQGTSVWLWLVVALYLIARVLHPFGMDGWFPGRMASTITTFTLSAILAIWALVVVGTTKNVVDPVTVTLAVPPAP